MIFQRFSRTIVIVLCAKIVANTGAKSAFGLPMKESAGPYLYDGPHQMLPMLPGEHKLESLRLLAAEMIAAAGELAAHGMPQLRLLLRDALR